MIYHYLESVSSSHAGLFARNCSPFMPGQTHVIGLDPQTIGAVSSPLGGYLVQGSTSLLRFLGGRRRGGGFSLVEHISDDSIPCSNKTQGSCCGHAEMVHGLTANKFTNTGAHHRTAIRHPGVWSFASSLNER